MWWSEEVFFKKDDLHIQYFHKKCLFLPKLQGWFLSNPYKSAKWSWIFMKPSGWVSGGLPRWSIMSRMTHSSKTPVRNLQHPPSMVFKDAGSWHTSNHARELKFGTQVKNHIWWQSIASNMTPSSKTPVRNLQHPPSMTLWMGCSFFDPVTQTKSI